MQLQHGADQYIAAELRSGAHRERQATPSSRTSRRGSCASTPTTSTGTTACCPKPGRTLPTPMRTWAASRSGPLVCATASHGHGSHHLGLLLSSAAAIAWQPSCNAMPNSMQPCMQHLPQSPDLQFYPSNILNYLGICLAACEEGFWQKGHIHLAFYAQHMLIFHLSAAPHY